MKSGENDVKIAMENRSLVAMELATVTNRVLFAIGWNSQKSKESVGCNSVKLLKTHTKNLFLFVKM